MASYVVKKEQKTVTLQKLGKNVYQLISIRYDADTREEIAPEIQQFTIEDIDKTVEEANKQLVLLQKRVENLGILKRDMLAIINTITSSGII